MIKIAPLDQSITPGPAFSAVSIRHIAPKPEGFISICVSNDKVILGSMKSKVKIFSLTQNKQLHTITAYSSKVKAMFVYKNFFFSGQQGEDGIIKVWQLEKYSLIRVLKGHTDTVQMITSIAENIIASASNDKTVRVWDISKPEETMYTLQHQYPVLVVQAINKDLLVSGGDDCLLILWEWTKQIKLRTVFAHSCSVNCLILKNDELVSAGGDGLVRFWNIDDLIDQNSNLSDDEQKKKKTNIQLSQSSIEHCCVYENGIIFVDDDNKMFKIQDYLSQEIEINVPYYETVTGIQSYHNQIIVITNQNDAQLFQLEPIASEDSNRKDIDNTFNEMLEIKI